LTEIFYKPLPRYSFNAIKELIRSFF